MTGTRLCKFKTRKKQAFLFIAFSRRESFKQLLADDDSSYMSSAGYLDENGRFNDAILIVDCFTGQNNASFTCETMLIVQNAVWTGLRFSLCSPLTIADLPPALPARCTHREERFQRRNARFQAAAADNAPNPLRLAASRGRATGENALVFRQSSSLHASRTSSASSSSSRSAFSLPTTLSKFGD